MKFELGNNDCEPCVVVTKVDGKFGRESDRVSYYELGGGLIAVSHQYGEVIFDDDVVEEGGIEYLVGENMAIETFESALGDKGFHAYLKQWCEEEHCTRALISRVDPGTRSTA